MLRKLPMGIALAVFVCSLSWTLAAQSTASQTSTAASSAVPNLINYGGVLKDAGGHTLTSVTGVTFLLYKDEQGGAPLWLETQNITPDRAGHYTVHLGANSTNGIPADMFISAEAHWLAIQIAGEAEQPRVLLVAVPYAMKAADAATIGGLPPSAFVLATPPANGAAANTSSSGPSAGGSQSSPPPPASSNVTTSGGTANFVSMFSTATNIQNSILSQTGTTAINVGGKLNQPAIGTATAAAGFNSRPHAFVASVFNSGTATPVAQTFQLQAEPINNNTATASGTLNLLYATGTATPTETGLKINNKGLITFAAGQTFPIAAAGVTNAMLQHPSLTVAAGTDLTGGGVVALGGSTTLNLDTTKVPQLAAANTFTNSQTINGNLSLSGNVSMSGAGTGITFPDGSTQHTASIFTSAANSGLVFPGAGVTNLLQLNITVPTAGAVSASASGYCNTNTGSTGVQWAYVIGQSAGEGWSFPEPLAYFPSGSNVGQFPISVSRVLPVSAGTNTIFLNVDNLIGTPLSSCGAQMTAIFTPTQLPAARAAMKQPQFAPLSKSGRKGTP